MVFPTRISMSPEVREEIVEMLNICLCSLVDLDHCVKHAHVNSKGSYFLSLHDMYDDFDKQLRKDIDKLAEVIVGMGGIAQVLCGYCIQLTVCPMIPVDELDGLTLAGHIADCHAAVRECLVEKVEELLEDNIQGVADTLLSVQYNIEKNLYKLEATLA